MSKRLARITHDFTNGLADCISKTVDIVGRDHRVYHVTLTKVDSVHLYGINLRGKKETFPINQILEVILQKEA